MLRDTPTQAKRDRADCTRATECRSPHTCHALARCADRLTLVEDRATFGSKANGRR